MPLSTSLGLRTGAFILGAIPTTIGLTILLSKPLLPIEVSGLSISPTATDSDRTTISALCYYFGVRDLSVGLITLAVWKLGDRTTLGTVILLLSGMAIGDGFVNVSAVPGTLWTHWGGVPIGVGIGCGLLGWLDGIL